MPSTCVSNLLVTHDNEVSAYETWNNGKPHEIEPDFFWRRENRSHSLASITVHTWTSFVVKRRRYPAC